MELFLVIPSGFCAGVENAIHSSNRVFDLFSQRPIYFYHQIVHNQHIKLDFESRGGVFVEDIEEISDNSVAVFSAHGVARAIEEAARRKNLTVINLTCPLVKKVHNSAKAHAEKNRDIIVIGHRNHQELKGTVGQIFGVEFHIVENANQAWEVIPKNPDLLAYVTQTTLSVDDVAKIVAVLKSRFPNIAGPSEGDICYATQNRQSALRRLIDLQKAELILVVGSQNSSNSSRLVEIARSLGARAFLIDDESDINESWFDNVRKIGVTAGASAPKKVINSVVKYLENRFQIQSQEVKFIEEDVFFHPPKILRDLEKINSSAA